MRRALALLVMCSGCPQGSREAGGDMTAPPDLLIAYDFAHPPVPDLSSTSDLAARDLAMPPDLGVPDLPLDAGADLAAPDGAPTDAGKSDGAPTDGNAADLALPKADLEINYCIIQFPKMTMTKANVATEPIYGQVYQQGLTDANNGPAPGIKAQLGYGPQGTDPRISNAWIWFDAMPNQGWNFSQNNDEYVATLTVPQPGGYSYAYRFSVTNGMGYTYCDTVGNGSNNGLPPFDPQKDGLLTVN